jgi:hypothetical protein
MEADRIKNKIIEIFEEYDPYSGLSHLYAKNSSRKHILPQVVVNTDKGYMNPPPTPLGDFTKAPQSGGIMAGSYNDLLEKGTELFDKNRSLPHWKDIKKAWLEIWFSGEKEPAEKIDLKIL